MKTQTLTWFGGKAGMVRDSDPERLLHLVSATSNGETICGLGDDLRPVTMREANRDGCWCMTCLQGAQ